METGNSFENLIIRYLNGECTYGEQEELYNLISRNPEKRRIFNETKDTWDSVPGINLSHDQQLIRFYKSLSERRRSLVLPNWKQAVAVAAVLAIGLFSGILLTQHKSSTNQHPVEFTVPYGSKSTFTLADGSNVTMNSGSHLVYSYDQKKRTRIARLDGEGYFVINHNADEPFIVHTSDFAVTVTGTEFNVCSYSDNSFSSVTLSEGSVNLTFNNSGQAFPMTPGERLRYERNSNRYSKQSVDIEPEIAWKDGEFIFRNMAFSELVRRLERWYDVQISWPEEELKDFTYTGRFKNQETIWQVLDALKLTTPIDYNRLDFREFNIAYKEKRQ